MAGFSDYLSLAVANWIRGSSMPTPPTELRVALSTTTVEKDGTQLTEPTGGYVRQVVNFSSAVVESDQGAFLRNSAPIVFGPATATWTGIRSVAVLDQAGNVLWSGDLPAAKTVVTGDTVSFGTGVFEFNVT